MQLRKMLSWEKMRQLYFTSKLENAEKDTNALLKCWSNNLVSASCNFRSENEIISI